jgi:glutathionylspermidine synthase
MQRLTVAARDGWRTKVEADGLLWHGNGAYWDDSSYYTFTLAEIERIEAATEDVHRLFVTATESIAASSDALDRLGIPRHCHRAIRESWERKPPALDYGRFDFGYDGSSDPKLFEYNCDTPTAMIETAIVQWAWKEDQFPDHDQFTSLHDKLIARWAALAPSIPGKRLWATHVADADHEDTITATYMRDLASQAGYETYGVIIDDIGIDADERFVDAHDRVMSAIFKLYPWEWMTAEAYGRTAIENNSGTIWIEPIWKMIWSSKAILALLWTMFPGHPNLLPATRDRRQAPRDHAAKPYHAREGANVRLFRDGRIIVENDGPLETMAGGTVYQALFPSRDFGHGYPVIGSWCVNGKAAGMGIREDGLITGNTARFVPHIIEG